MSSHVPQDSGHPTNAPATSRKASLRTLPGFKTAAIAFVLTVLLGGGGIAVANWNQSATATITITAGAAATTSPPPIGPAPNIVANPGIVARPAKADAVICEPNGNSGKFLFTWAPSGTPNPTRYLVSLSASNGSRTATESVSTGFYRYDFLSNGVYVLRVQSMIGSSAGEPAYTEVRHINDGSQRCRTVSSGGTSPLGTFAFSSAVAAAPNTNVLNLTWNKAASATRYLVSIKDPTTGYGAEFTSTAIPTATTPVPLIFPTTAHQSAPPYGNYTLRIIPMKDNPGGDEAGDPVYQTVSYQSTGLTVSNYRSIP